MGEMEPCEEEVADFLIHDGRLEVFEKLVVLQIFLVDFKELHASVGELHMESAAYVGEEEGEVEVLFHLPGLELGVCQKVFVGCETPEFLSCGLPVVLGDAQLLTRQELEANEVVIEVSAHHFGADALYRQVFSKQVLAQEVDKGALARTFLDRKSVV